MANTGEEWPPYLPGPREDIFALGVISLNYGQLENMFRALVSGVARWNEFQTAAVFHRLPNNHRVEVVSELMSKTTMPDEIKGLIDHFLKGFAKCAETRNLIMHSSSGGVHASQEAHGLVLQRYTKAGNREVCYVTTADLRRIADEIHAYTGFGAWVITEITNYATHLHPKGPPEYRPLPSTLREKPPPPTSLRWRSPDAPKSRDIPPAALPLISPYRVHDQK